MRRGLGRLGRGVVAAFVFAALPPILAAEGQDAPPELELPVDCEMGRDCFIQYYVDRDAGPRAADYRCGALSYDGHKGTDIRVRNLPAMRRGIVVLAAAAGTVRAIRDGEPDIRVSDSTRSVDGREAGNSVVLVHGEEWETQYSHLMKGSVTVRPGQRVEAGAPLGLIGHSGKSDFPHLEFLVRRNGKTVDPFGGDDTSACAFAGTPLWTPDALGALQYLPGAVLQAGFATHEPERGEVRSGTLRARDLSVFAPNLIYWVQMFGIAKGDIELLRIFAPDGSILIERRKQFEKPWIHNISWVGKRRPGAAGWVAGIYRGEFLVFREIKGELQPIFGSAREVTLR